MVTMFTNRIIKVAIPTAGIKLTSKTLSCIALKLGKSKHEI